MGCTYPPTEQSRSPRVLTLNILTSGPLVKQSQRGTWLHEELISLTSERLQTDDNEGKDYWKNLVRIPSLSVLSLLRAILLHR
eukprot:1185611-Prorocentrum_minimum.AAC.4